MTWLWENSRQTNNRLLMLLAMADHADDFGGNIYPSIKRLAYKVRVEERQAQYLISELEKSGDIIRESKGGGRGRTARWRIPVDEKVQGRAPFNETVQSKGAIQRQERVQDSVVKGALATAPDPYDPSLEPSEDRRFNPFVKKKTDPIIVNGWEQFWNLYPKKTEKVAAAKAWQKLKPDLVLQTAILTRLKKFIALDWVGTEKAYIPNPATWLNKRKWEDEIVNPPARNGNGYHPPEDERPRPTLKDQLREKGMMQ